MAIINRKKYGYTGFVENIPHLRFWRLLSELVQAGCVVMYESIRGLIKDEEIEEAAEPFLSASAADDYRLNIDIDDASNTAL